MLFSSTCWYRYFPAPRILKYPPCPAVHSPILLLASDNQDYGFGLSRTSTQIPFVGLCDFVNYQEERKIPVLLATSSYLLHS